MKKIPGLSLLEILLVIAIIGIFMALALPNLMGVVSDARSAEAQAQLNHLHTLQQSHFFKKAKYSSSLEDLNFIQETLSTNGGSANYKVEIISASASSFEAKAEAVVDFDQDGQKNVWSINEKKELKELVKD